MKNFKVRFILLIHRIVKDKLGIDLVSTAQDIIKLPVSFNTTGGYQGKYSAATYDVVGEQDGVSYQLRFYTRYGSISDALLSDPIIDSARNGVADIVYAFNLTLQEEELIEFPKDDMFPTLSGQTLNRRDYCKDKFSVNLRDAYGNLLCASIGSIPVITLTDGDVSVFQDTTWVDPGYVALDDEDGDITANVSVQGEIDTSIIGEQVLIYSVTDSDGGSFSIPRTVTVRSPNVLPIINLNPLPNGGITPVTLIQNSTYEEPGATATDTEDGDISNRILITGDTVNMSVPGTYTVIYSVTDDDGATAVMTREIIVQENDLPTITLNPMPNGDVTPINLQYGGTFVDPGATATDSESGDITNRIVISGDVVDTTVAGTYTIIYTVTDDNQGSGTAQRRVVVAENEPPVITLNDYNGVTTPINIPYGSDYTDPGATATDLEDGDITNSIIVGGSINTNAPGPHTITYTVTDSGGLSSIATRVVNVAANTAPTLILNEYQAAGVASPIVLPYGSIWNDPGYVATDSEDGDITNDVVISGDTVDTLNAGTYNIVYTVFDSAGLGTSVTRIVTVEAQNLLPTIILLPDAAGDTSPITFNTQDGGVWTDPGATATDPEDGDLTNDIVRTCSTLDNFDGTIQADASLVGTHNIVYTVTDSKGESSTMTRVLHVINDQAPTLTLNAMPSGTIDGNIILGTEWVDPGYTATDTEDGNLNNAVVISGDIVDTSTVGTYTITYSVTDGSGQTVTVTRTVNVVNTEPTITLLGDNPQILPFGSQWVDPGATAVDEQDGDITDQIQVVGADAVDTNVAGNYNVVYTVTDANGAIVTVTRTVTIAANVGPTIVLNPINGVTTPVTLNLNDTWTDPGATATDPEDGDISANIVVGGDTVDTSVGSNYTITYSITDSANATATVTRQVHIIGNEPTITLNAASDGSLETVYRKIGTGADYVEPGATAMDSEDGNITQNLHMTNDKVSGSWNLGDIIACDLNHEDTYNITYSVTDSDGLAASKSRVIHISQMISTITLNEDAHGNSLHVFVVAGDTWTDPGYTLETWEDTPSGTVVVGGDTVDTSTAGVDFTINYSYNDAHGGSTSATRLVTIVQEQTVITLLPGDEGISPVNTPQGLPWQDPGYTGWDINNGNVTADVVISGDTVNTNSLGTYTITYTLTSTGTDTKTREVHVVPNNVPVISIIGDNPLHVVNGQPYNELGATASDIEDGDISDQIIFSGDYVDTNTNGTYNVIYSVTDSDGNLVSATRVVTVADDQPPVLTLIGPDTVNITENGTYTEQGATAHDDLDGDISANINIGGDTVDTSTVGSYNVVYTITDSVGHTASKTRVVNVVANALPTITLLGDNPFDLTRTDAFVDPGATATDTEDGDITDDIIVDDSGLDVNTIGTYSVNYTVTDANGGTATETRVVNVVANNAPVITLAGSNPMQVEWNGTYNEPGYVATDAEDGDITNDVVIGGDTVDTSIETTYNITYTVTDSHGATTTETRVVNIVDTNVAPTITLLGDNPQYVLEGTVWNDPGATATDPEDGDITDDIILIGTVDTAVVGSHTIEYSITDSGSKGASVQRTVIVTPNNNPTLTLLGGNSVDVITSTPNRRVLQGSGTHPDWNNSMTYDTAHTYQTGDDFDITAVVDEFGAALVLRDHYSNTFDGSEFDDFQNSANGYTLNTKPQSNGKLNYNVNGTSGDSTTDALLGDIVGFRRTGTSFEMYLRHASDNSEEILHTGTGQYANYLNAYKWGPDQLRLLNVTPAPTWHDHPQWRTKTGLPLGVYTLDGGLGDAVTGLPGNVTNVTAGTEGGVFNGTDSKVELPFGLKGPHTIAMKIKLNSIGSESYLIFAAYDIYIYVKTDGTIRAFKYDGTTFYDTSTSNYSLTAGQVYDVVFTYDGTSSSLRVNDDVFTPIDGTMPLDKLEENNLTIGQDTENGHTMDGEIWDVSIYPEVVEYPWMHDSLNGYLTEPYDGRNGYEDPGATANDPEDGDITDDIVVDTTQVDTGTPGTYNVTYTVADSDGNTSTETRVVNVVAAPQAPSANLEDVADTPVYALVDTTLVPQAPTPGVPINLSGSGTVEDVPASPSYTIEDVA